MTSEVLKLYPLEAVNLSDYRFSFIPDEEEIEHELACIVNRHIRWEDGHVIAKGDVVVLDLASPIAKFNRKQLHLTVGLGLFHKGLEGSLIGRSTGESFFFAVDGETVCVTIQSIRNRIAPALTDELVEQEQLDGIHTVAELRADLLHKQKQSVVEEHVHAASEYVIQTIFEQSRILVTQEDWKNYCDLRVRQLKGFCSFEGLVLEEMTASDFDGRIPVRSYHEFVVMMLQEAWEAVRAKLIGEIFLKEEGKLPSKAGYEAFIAKGAAEWKRSYEEYEAICPFALYDHFTCSSAFYQHVYDFVTNYLMEEC